MKRKYIKFLPLEFLMAVLPYPLIVAGAFFRALCEYWQRDSIGLADEPEVLRLVCGCNEVEWVTVGPVVFGELFFKDEKGLWHCERCRRL